MKPIFFTLIFLLIASSCAEKIDYQTIARKELNMIKTGSVTEYINTNDSMALTGKYKITDPKRYFIAVFKDGFLEGNVKHFKSNISDDEYKLWMESNYVKGELNGQNKTYNKQGGLIEIKHFRKGVVKGLEKFNQDTIE